MRLLTAPKPLQQRCGLVAQLVHRGSRSGVDLALVEHVRDPGHRLDHGLGERLAVGSAVPGVGHPGNPQQQLLGVERVQQSPTATPWRGTDPAAPPQTPSAGTPSSHLLPKRPAALLNLSAARPPRAPHAATASSRPRPTFRTTPPTSQRPSRWRRPRTTGWARTATAKAAEAAALEALQLDRTRASGRRRSDGRRPASP